MTGFPRTCFSPRARCRLAAWSLIATAGSAWAQEPASPGPVGAAAAPAAEALAACAGEDDPGRRLACFDALVPPRATASLAQALPQHTAVVAQHHGRRGHPVGFASGLYSELMSLVGEDGLRRLLARYPAHGVEVADAGVLFDVDTEADLEAARAMVPALGLAG